jgi:nucleoid-associated protein YejK
MFVFKIKRMQIKEKLKIFDHGYVDINRHDIAAKHFKEEEEYILNALNVYKVTKI